MATTFKIQSLLTKNGDNISGPMSPVLFAKEMTVQIQTTYDLLARVYYEDESLLQRREDGGFTGYDLLIIGKHYTNDLYLSLWVDEGVTGCPVAMAFQTERKVMVTTVYTKAKYAAKLSVKEINELFSYVFDNPQSISIKEEVPLKP